MCSDVDASTSSSSSQFGAIAYNLLAIGRTIRANQAVQFQYIRLKSSLEDAMGKRSVRMKHGVQPPKEFFLYHLGLELYSKSISSFRILPPAAVQQLP